MSKETKDFYEFGPFRVDARRRVLLRDHTPLPLLPKAFDTLLVLVQNTGRVLEKDELMKLLWPNSFVEEANLAQNISVLRKALGEQPSEHRYIVTVPGRGYRFAVPVRHLPAQDGEVVLVGHSRSRVTIEVQEEQPAEQGHAGLPGTLPIAAQAELGAVLPRTAHVRPSRVRWRLFALAGGILAALVALLVGLNIPSWRERLRPRPAQGFIQSLAVLPLENLSRDPEQEYFAEGMTEALITDLSKIGTLKVISRTSAMRYRRVEKPLPQIARELGVDAVVTGSVLREGNQVRISVQLIHGATDKHLWAENYQRELRGILSLQSEVARAVAQQVKITLTPQEQTRLASARSINPDAYELYLKGRYEWYKRRAESLKDSIGYFQKAIERDPSYAQAYAGLADVYNVMPAYLRLSPEETAPKARVAAMKALELDDSLAEAHTDLAMVRSHYDWDWAGAEKEFQRAIELNPNYANAHYFYGFSCLITLGRLDQALREMKRAQELDPLSPIINTNLGWTLIFARQYDAAIEQLRKTIALDPHFGPPHRRLATALQQEGRYAEAVEEYLRAGASPSAMTEQQFADLRKAYASSGWRGFLQKRVEFLLANRKRNYVSAEALAHNYALLGNKEKALEWLERAVAERDEWVTYLNVNPEFDALRYDPRFQALLRRIGLPP